MNLTDLFNESENPFQHVLDKLAAQDKKIDREHTQGLKDIEDRAAKRDQASREKWSKDLRKGMSEGDAQSSERDQRIAQGWAAKHPNIDAEIAQVANELKRYGNYERTTSGSQYADAKQLASKLNHLKQIKAIIDSVEQGQAEGSEKHECPYCLGSGRMVRDPDIGTDQECFVCDGTGYDDEQGVAEASLKQRIKTTLRKLDPTIKGRLKDKADDAFDYGLELDNDYDDDFISGAPASAYMKHAAHLDRLAKGEKPFQDKPKKQGVAESSFATTMKKAIDAHERGDHKRAKYHLDNAKTARYGLKSTEIGKHKDLLDKYKELRDMHEQQGVAEGSDEGKTQKYEMMLSNGKVKRFTAKDDADAKRIAKGHGAKSVIKMKGDLPGNKIAEQGVAEDQALDELTGWKQSAPQQKTSAQPKKPTTGELLKKSGDKRSELQRNYDAGKKNWFKEGLAESEYGIPDETPGHLPGGPKMTFGEFKKMWPGVILKRPSGGSLAGSVVADVEGWMNNPKSVWEPLEGVAEGSLDEIDRRGFLKGLGAAAATAAVPAIAQAKSGIDYNKVQMLHDQMFKKNPQYAKEWQAANGERVRAFIKSKDPAFRDRATARKARLDMTAKILQKYGVKNLNENQFEPINDDDYYEYNVDTKEIVKHISGKHPIASKFNPLQREWPGRDADHKIVRGLQAKYLKDDVVDEKVSDYLPDPLINKHSIVKGWRKAKGLDEKAPPGDKAERMVKHIKQSYAKDGKLTDKEKSIAYATAWKAHNAGKV